MVRCARLLSLALLLGCGAKSGVEVEPPAEREAGPFDAGFDTFPCRWSLAQPTLLARSPEPFEARGAIHAVRDEALVVWRAGSFVGGLRLMLADPPPVIARPGAEAFPPPDSRGLHGVGLADPSVSWVSLDARGPCQLLTMGEEPPWRESVVFPAATGCTLEAQDPSRVDLTVVTAEGVTLWSSSDLASPAERALAMAPPRRARSARLPGLGWMVASVREGRLIVHWVDDAGVQSVELGSHDGLAPLELVPDRVRPGVVLFHRDPAGSWHLQRIPFETRRALELADLSELTAAPLGTLAANETEAMLPLADGRLAVVPVDGSALRFVGPVDGAPIGQMEVVLRPGSSGGGLLYTNRTAGEHNLLFQPLTCNR